MPIAALMAATLVVAVPAFPAFAAEKPVAAEHNPPGDIPDTQVFVAYESPLGFTLKVPEGWARSAQSDEVHFSDKYNNIDVMISATTTQPTISSVKSNQIPALQKSSRAVRVGKIMDVRLRGGPSVQISYTSNSDPNPVTNKQIRLEHDRYLFYRNGRLVMLDFAAPKGADNVDAWALMANSFHWR
jgi:hypothetical protein